MDVIELKNLLVVHDSKNTKYEVEEENEWFHTISNCIRQANDTPAIDLALSSTCNSMLNDTNEDHFWPRLQLQPSEIECLASNHWLSDLLVYRTIELINESSPDIFAFYYNFVGDFRTIVQKLMSSIEI